MAAEWHIHPEALARWCRGIVAVSPPMQVRIWIDSLKSALRTAGA